MLRRDAGQVSVLGMDNLTYDRRIKEEVGVVLDDVGFPGCLTPKQIGNILRRTYQIGTMILTRSSLKDSVCRRIKRLMPFRAA